MTLYDTVYTLYLQFNFRLIIDKGNIMNNKLLLLIITTLPLSIIPTMRLNAEQLMKLYNIPSHVVNGYYGSSWQEKSQSSLEVQITSLPKEGFWQKNLGTILTTLLGSLLGAFFAGAIAVYSIRKTDKNNRNVENRRRDKDKLRQTNLYCGVIYLVVYELFNQNHLDEKIRPELSAILIASEDKGVLITDRSSLFLSLDFLHDLRKRLLDFENFNTKLVSTISLYINSVEGLNYSLDFTQMKITIDRLDGKLDFAEAIHRYFMTLFEHLDKLKKAREELIRAIIHEIKSFPQNNIIISEEVVSYLESSEEGEKDSE